MVVKKIFLISKFKYVASYLDELKYFEESRFDFAYILDDAALTVVVDAKPMAELGAIATNI